MLGVPERLLPKREPLPGGTRWQSADGRDHPRDEVVSRPARPTSTRCSPASPRRRRTGKVTYKIMRPDFFVVTAETATGKSYIRYAAGAAGIRGFTLGYDKACAGRGRPPRHRRRQQLRALPDAAAAAAAAPERGRRPAAGARRPCRGQLAGRRPRPAWWWRRAGC